MSDTFQIDVEYTDTFGGEPNYCWVKRQTLTLPKGLSNRAIVRRMKAAMGLTGYRGRMDTYGDSWAFRPYGSCTVMLGQVRY
jgi:hypothetical protein